MHGKRILQCKYAAVAVAGAELRKRAARRTDGGYALLQTDPSGRDVFRQHGFKQAALHRKAAKTLPLRCTKARADIQHKPRAAR